MMIRLGLCCIFKEQPFKFKQTTAAALTRLDRQAQLAKVADICRDNLRTLLTVLQWLDGHGIGAFRILSPLFPRYTHPVVGYRLDELPHCQEILSLGQQIKEYRQNRNIRLSLHPDQFNVLSSPHPEVIAKTLAELEYQGVLAKLLGAEVITLHGGGAYGDKESALARFQRNFQQLSTTVQQRLSLENDDVTYTPSDLLPVCRSLGIPMVYDVHHHRCLPDPLSIDMATDFCLKIWQDLGREPWLHISSPRDGWHSGKPRHHGDYVDPQDLPRPWLGLTATIDVEAKAKELAVLKLQAWLASQGSTS